MTHTWFTRSATAWICLAATALLLQGCAQSAGWNGIFAVDVAGAARTCVAPPAAPPDGRSVLAQVQVSNEGGWCGVTTNRSGAAFDSYLLVVRPKHGTVYAHHVGTNTRIDYRPDVGYVGTDSFAVRMIPGDGTLEEAITVTR